MERRRVLILYGAQDDGGVRPVEVDPYGMVYRKGAWRLIGFSATHRRTREFHVSRVAAVLPTPLHFTADARSSPQSSI